MILRARSICCSCQQQLLSIPEKSGSGSSELSVLPAAMTRTFPAQAFFQSRKLLWLASLSSNVSEKHGPAARCPLQVEEGKGCLHPKTSKRNLCGFHGSRCSSGPCGLAHRAVPHTPAQLLLLRHLCRNEATHEKKGSLALIKPYCLKTK